MSFPSATQTTNGIGIKKQKRRGTNRHTDVNMSTYIVKLHKNQSLNNEGKRKAFSKSAVMEVQLLMESAIATITQNAGLILDYSGTETLGVKTATAATVVALSGLLRDNAKDAGEQALKNYEAATSNSKECVV